MSQVIEEVMGGMGISLLLSKTHKVVKIRNAPEVDRRKLRKLNKILKGKHVLIQDAKENEYGAKVADVYVNLAEVAGELI